MRKQGLKSGCCFSALIETEHASPILFDTGGDGSVLLHNMRELGIDARRIGTIVISHAHGDHTGGLQSILEVNGDAEIYVPSSSWRQLPGRKVTAVTGLVQICAGVFSTGELKGVEQSLALRTNKGIVVLTGCSHPGVSEILQAASRFGEVSGIVGGLHGFHDFDRLRELSLICPCHCTQYKSEICQLFSDRCEECGAGLTLEF
ncbi:MAG: MBL fold metallo-hydrolase [candidate division Zixibacteria bacterium]|nr:MBL fold metallo-hydrolase [candidate division Zixibacteria bacterium]